MILITRGSVNTVIVTLTEKVTISNPKFLFSFTNDVSKSTKNFLSADISSYTERYNKFSITETSSAESPLIGVVKLTPTGFWSYKIYAQTSTSNLDPALANELVETGKVKVITTDASDTAYDSQTKTSQVYVG